MDPRPGGRRARAVDVRGVSGGATGDDRRAPWKPEHARRARAEIADGKVTIENVRDGRHPPGGPPEIRWTTRRYELDRIRRLWFVVEPFVPSLPFVAHTFVAFEFEDDFLALSIEARQRTDQRYSIVAGLFGAYELIYVFGDERDLFLGRTVHREHELHLYPLVTPMIEAQAFFLTTVATANALAERPRRYDSLRANCTNLLRRHANQVRPGSFPPFTLADVMPGRSSTLLYRKGWIDTNASERELRDAHAIRARANAIGPVAEFSERVRAPWRND